MGANAHFCHDLSASVYHKVYLYIYYLGKQITFHLSMYEQEQVAVMEHQMVVDLEKYLVQMKVHYWVPMLAPNWVH